MSADRPPTWPPIIIRTDLPLWVRARDLGLAVIGWVVLQDLLYDFWVLMYDWLKYPIFVLDPKDAPDWDTIYARLEPFLLAGGAIVFSIIVTAIWRRRHIARSIDLQKPTPGSLSAGVHPMQVSSRSVSELHQLRSVDVYVDAAGDIAEVRARRETPL
jgi:hypothetical protein